ncbi:LacI family DNA-binding transcriptional regulator [Pokkaliibacter sp. CJK22405]|uniref:LacI family DNA-binding transcriptional regulator n=1 Tax=Pokkaliibacter sp. CJK22405 TaxID=3384615 RepID=UPI003984C176
MAKKNQVTIADIAKRVNLTNITVSRALSKPEMVKPETLARILEVARELNYVPNAFARSLKRSESRIIGLVTASIDNPFYGDVIKAISWEAKKHDYSLMLFDTDGSAELETKAIETLLSYQVAGIILSPISDAPDYRPPYLGALEQSRIPVVQIDRALAETPFSKVVLDNYDSGYKAAQWLVSHEVRSILALTGPEHSHITRERFRGLEQAIKESGRAISVEVIPGDYTLNPAMEATRDFLQTHPVPDGIFGFNQLITLGAMRALRQAQLDSRHVQLVGIDRLPFADIFGVKVPCVCHDTTKAGTSAITLLLDKIRDPALGTQEIVVAGELIA